VETLVLAVCLRMVGAAVADVNAQADEPHAKPGQRSLPAVTPGRAVIGVDALVGHSARTPVRAPPARSRGVRCPARRGRGCNANGRQGWSADGSALRGLC